MKASSLSPGGLYRGAVGLKTNDVAGQRIPGPEHGRVPGVFVAAEDRTVGPSGGKVLPQFFTQA